MKSLSLEGGKKLLSLARTALKGRPSRSRERMRKRIQEAGMVDELSKNRANYVRVEIGGKLKACVGEFFPVERISLAESVVRHTLRAAYGDLEELKAEDDVRVKRAKVRIYLVGQIVGMRERGEELKRYIEEHRPGLIISKGSGSALMLPGDWEGYGDGGEVLDDLSKRAGVGEELWRKFSYSREGGHESEIAVWRFGVEEVM